MEELKKWALGVCTAAIFSSVIYAIVPKGNMQKIMRCVTALAVICALVFPLASAIMKTNFSASSPDTEALISSELNNEVNYRLTAAYAQQMQDGVQEILASYGYLDCEIDLLTDIDEYGGIFIKKANIILPDGAVLKEAAVEKLQNLLGDAVIDIRTGSTS
ncbi:MAG: stage III sporulation protein AF [Clostridiales bacterium]